MINKSASLRLSVITEPYLGPSLSSFPVQKFLENLQRDLEKLYVDFFANVKRWLKPGATVVFAFPYWKKSGGGREQMTRCIEKICGLGYSKTAFVPLQKDSLFYERPDQTVGREIIKFIPE